ncbi:MAG: GntR family transcriptional regulator [Desulfovermiculus sp.]|nr:GntR family transcriptional regulator [Desulfovermiculus sp.]
MTETPHTGQCLVDVAYAHMARRIVFMDYAPGQRLEEKQLMHDMQLGRTPIREALMRLSADMVVESRPKSGYFVRPITLQSIRSVFEALYLLEGGLADLAVKNDCSREIERMQLANEQMKKEVKQNKIRELVEANEDFHAYLARCTRNEYLIQAICRVRTEIKRLAYLSFSQDMDTENSLNAHYQCVLKEHDEMIQALRSRDHQALSRLLTTHIHSFQKRIMRSMMS